MTLPRKINVFAGWFYYIWKRWTLFFISNAFSHYFLSIFRRQPRMIIYFLHLTFCWNFYNSIKHNDIIIIKYINAINHVVYLLPQYFCFTKKLVEILITVKHGTVIIITFNRNSLVLLVFSFELQTIFSRAISDIYPSSRVLETAYRLVVLIGLRHHQQNALQATNRFTF